MATQVKEAPKTPAQRKALAAKIAKDRDAGMSGQGLREKYGSWLTGPVRRGLFREFGHDGLIARSYDRAEAKVKREAAMKKLEEASAAKRKVAASKPARKRQPAKKAATPVTEVAATVEQPAS